MLVARLVVSLQQRLRNTLLLGAGQYVNAPRLNVGPAGSEPRHLENVLDRLSRYRTLRKCPAGKALLDDAVDNLLTKISVVPQGRRGSYFLLSRGHPPSSSGLKASSPGIVAKSL